MSSMLSERSGSSTKPVPSSLKDGDVHVWCADLRERWPQSLLYGLLSEEERLRASHFAFEEDRRQYVHAHGLLRILLGRYLDRSPATIRFMAGRNGKPCLWLGLETMRFNLSHARDLVLYAFAHSREVGIDVEWRDQELSWRDVAEYACSEREQAALSSLSEPAQIDTFFSWWTLKEAYVKALGTGIELPLNRIDVADRRGTPSTVLAHGDSREQRWTMLTLPLGREYAGALVTQGRPERVRCFQWRWDAEAVLVTRSEANRGEVEKHHARRS